MYLPTGSQVRPFTRPEWPLRVARISVAQIRSVGKTSPGENSVWKHRQGAGGPREGASGAAPASPRPRSPPLSCWERSPAARLPSGQEATRQSRPDRPCAVGSLLVLAEDEGMQDGTRPTGREQEAPRGLETQGWPGSAVGRDSSLSAGKPAFCRGNVFACSCPRASERRRGQRLTPRGGRTSWHAAARGLGYCCL